MATSLTTAQIESAFRQACDAELTALKPGNVHTYAPGHGMDVDHFRSAAAAAAPHIANPSLSVGQRILRATEASVAATGVNTNLGIVLLCAPLAKAAVETDVSMGLRRRLAVILGLLDAADARDAFAAIRLANPAGLGRVEAGDVSQTGPEMTLIAAMQLAAHRDRIAHAYVTAYEDIFDLALPTYLAALSLAAAPDLAVTTLHMAMLAEFPDSHIARKFGIETASAVKHDAGLLGHHWQPVATVQSRAALLKFDGELKAKGLNPGTTADLVVATLFTALISGRKQP